MNLSLKILLLPSPRYLLLFDLVPRDLQLLNRYSVQAEAYGIAGDTLAFQVLETNEEHGQRKRDPRVNCHFGRI